jgi:hypothetical protein
VATPPPNAFSVPAISYNRGQSLWHAIYARCCVRALCRRNPATLREQLAGTQKVEFVHLCALIARDNSMSLWKTCGQDDELAERISSALEKQSWHALDRSPSPPPTRTYLPPYAP